MHEITTSIKFFIFISALKNGPICHLIKNLTKSIVHNLCFQGCATSIISKTANSGTKSAVQTRFSVHLHSVSTTCWFSEHYFCCPRKLDMIADYGPLSFFRATQFSWCNMIFHWGNFISWFDAWARTVFRSDDIPTIIFCERQ